MSKDYELWEAVYVSTEDLSRRPQNIVVFAGKDMLACAREARDLEIDMINRKDAFYPDGGMPMLYSLRYIGMPYIVEEKDINAT